MNPLILAFVGDAYYNLFIKHELAKKGEQKINDLHKQASKLVCAKNQSKLFDVILPLLDEAEKEIANRARNTKQNTYPKNCTLAEYKLATAFEAVIGYHYLMGKHDRLNELLKAVFDGK